MKKKKFDEDKETQSKTKILEKENDAIIVKIMTHLKKHLKRKITTELNDKINCLNNFCKGDGCGLTGGTLIDIFITKFLIKNLPKFKECHDDEADCMIRNERLSFTPLNI